MAFFDTTWYVNSVGYTAVTVRPQNTAVVAGVIRKQFTAPAVGSERCFICIVAGTTANTTDATWTLTRGAKTTDGTATWQECTGQASLNGDLTNTQSWAVIKAIGGTITLGAIIQRNNGASYHICSTAGSIGASEPAFSNTAGATVADSTTTWTCLGPVGNFTGGQAPHARLANACASTWWVTGNTIYVGDNHAESQATTMTIAPTLSQTTIGKIICHNHSGSYPPASGDVTTGATISVTAGTVAFNINPTSGVIYINGIGFLNGVGASTGNSHFFLTPNGAYYYFENCYFKIANTASVASTVQLNTTAAGTVLWNNCTVSFGNAVNYIDVGTVDFTWQNTGQILISGSAVPTGMLAPSANGRFSNTVLEALDLSQLSGNLTGTQGAQALGSLLVKDCKLHASMGLAAVTMRGQMIQFMRSDS